ncbi:MAG: hypothetical protein F4227_06025 [Gammaproteobacteria bacterium]|nr:hypothetical protein [Gammaproteobacteria bacterium]MYF02521.1 hypothetical protein [Gammaproteobacteria bacterium]MYI77714.1 hypothetical protein [Gammaproteobacteria bacterium]
MKKAGKIIAAIFASICIVVSIVTVGVAFFAKIAQEDPEAFTEEFYKSSSSFDNMSESEREIAEETMEDILNWILNLDHGKVLSQGIVGAILSIIILVTVLMNLPNMPIVTPAIACGASLVGAIYCGWLILIFMVITLFASGLVLLANMQNEKTN